MAEVADYGQAHTGPSPVPVSWPVLGAYLPFFEYRGRYALLVGGAGSGKSTAAAQMMLARCLAEPGLRLLAVRKIAATLRRSVLALLEQQIALHGLKDRFTVSLSNMAVRCQDTGSEILLSGLDDPEKIKSIHGIGSIWVEEATELTARDFQQLELRVRTKDGSLKQFVLTLNPTDQQHWIYNRFIKGAEDAPPNGRTLMLRTTYIDNPHLDADFVHFLEGELKADEDAYRIYTLGQWGQVRSGAEFYKEFRYAAHCHPVAYRPELPLLVTVDFNVTPYITGLVWQHDPDTGLASQIAELCLRSPRNTSEALAKAIADKYEGHTAGLTLFGDPSGRQHHTSTAMTDYDVLEQGLAHMDLRLRIARHAPEVAARGRFINQVLAGRVPGCTIAIDPACTESLADLAQVIEDDARRKVKLVSIDPRAPASRCQLRGHCSDAMDYLLTSLWQGQFYPATRRPHKPLPDPLMG